MNKFVIHGRFNSFSLIETLNPYANANAIVPQSYLNQPCEAKALNFSSVPRKGKIPGYHRQTRFRSSPSPPSPLQLHNPTSINPAPTFHDRPFSPDPPDLRALALALESRDIDSVLCSFFARRVVDARAALDAPTHGIAPGAVFWERSVGRKGGEVDVCLVFGGGAGWDVSIVVAAGWGCGWHGVAVF